MNKRQFAALAALVAGAALLFVGIHQRGHSVLPTIGSQAVAQATDNAYIEAKAVPGVPGVDDDWQRYEFTVPPTSPPLDMHVVLFIDGKGNDFLYENNKPWENPIPVRYLLSNDDDSRVKAILKAQGFPVKDQLVTYHFTVGTLGGTLGFDQTLKFAHSSGNGGLSVFLPQGGPSEKVSVGQKIMLSDKVIPDSQFHRDGDFMADIGHLSRFPADQVHRMTIYVQFEPHKGPLPPCYTSTVNAISRAAW